MSSSSWLTCLSEKLPVEKPCLALGLMGSKSCPFLYFIVKVTLRPLSSRNGRGSVTLSAVYDPLESRFVCSSAGFRRWCYTVICLLPMRKAGRTPASAAPQLTFGLRPLLSWMLRNMKLGLFSPYFLWRELFLLQAELWRTLWWKQNCSHQKRSWHTARPFLLLVVEGRAKSSVWGILCGSVCQDVVDQGWENMDLSSQDYDSCECDWYEATQGAECFALIKQDNVMLEFDCICLHYN